MLILVRITGEIAIKSAKVSRQFQNLLVENIRDLLRSSMIEFKLGWEWNRITVTTMDSRAPSLLCKVYGVQSVSVLEVSCPATLEEMTKLAVATYGPIVAGHSFAVRAQRVGRHSFTSVDVNRAVGAALRPYARETDLETPEVQVNIEIREDLAYFYLESQKGPGGFPLRSGGRALCLISGGFDSAVAAWMVQNRGVSLDYVFFNLAGVSYERSVLKVAQHLAAHWSWGTRPRIYIVDFATIVAAMQEKLTPRYLQVVLKRLFYRAAALCARECRAEALVSGEAIGQVSSQTLQNLSVISAASPLLILRPLLTYNKDHIVELSRKIGTYDLSASIQEYCQLTKHKPATHATIDPIEREEAKLDVEGLISTAIAGKRVIDLRSLTPADLLATYVQIDQIPDHAVVVDCRSEAEFASGHFKTAHHIEFHDLLATYSGFDKTKTYVLYCSLGVQSAIAAEAMQNKGFIAYSLKGGTKLISFASNV